MASLDLNSQMQYGDATTLAIWFLGHTQAHLNYANALFKLTGKQVPGMDLNDDGCLADWVLAMKEGKDGRITDRMNNWLYAHQNLHAAEIVDLGDSTPVDLTTVDFREEGQFYDWMFNHSSLHDAEDTAFKTSS